MGMFGFEFSDPYSGFPDAFDADDMRRQAFFSGLQQMGLGIMNPDPSTPPSFGRTLGKALGGFAQGADQGRQEYEQQGMTRLKMEEYQKAEADKKRQKEALTELLADSDLDPPLRNWVLANPDQAWNVIKGQFETPEPYTLGEGQTRFDSSGKPISSAPKTPPIPDPFTLGEGQTRYDPSGRAIASVPRESKAPFTREFKIGNEVVTQEWRDGKWTEVGRGAAFRQGPDTVINTGENAYAKERGGAQAKVANELDAQGRSAQRDLTTLKFMENAIKGPSFYSGFGQTHIAHLKRAAVAIGISDPSAVVDMETFNGLAKQQAINSLGGSLGTGFSNADRDFVLEQVPNLGNTPEGNKALILIHRKFAERKIEIGKMAREYERKHGQLDAGFEDELAAWAEAHPLFAAEAGIVPPSLSDIEKEIQRRGLAP